MAITTTHKEVSFGVGDVIRVYQRLFEGEKSRLQVFEGTVLAIRGRDNGKSVVVRRIGSQRIGMEMIFPLSAPVIEKIEVSREGVKGSRHAKLYFTRSKSHKEIEKIYSRIHKKDVAPVQKTQKPKAVKAKSSKKTSK